jgi:sugar lactone lactonase YvrE
VVTVARNGDVLIADAGRHQVLRRSPDGRVTVVAGTGTAGFSGDNEPAVDAMLNAPRAIAAGPDGTLYVGDTSNNRVRAIDRDGVVTTIATLPSPQSLAFGADGQLLVADSTGVERFETDGSITTVLPAGPGRYVINGTASAFFPSAVAVDGSGNLIVASFSPKYVARFTPDGSFVEAWDDYVAPAGIATGPDGVAYLASYGGFSIERLTATGPVPAVTFTSNSIPGIHGTFRPQGVAVGPDGTIYAITDGGGTTNDRALISIAANGSVTALIVN